MKIIQVISHDKVLVGLDDEGTVWEYLMRVNPETGIYNPPAWVKLVESPKLEPTRKPKPKKKPPKRKK